MKLRMKTLLHIVILEVEVLILLVVLAFSFLQVFLPTGWTSTGAGDCLRFRFATGQDELVRKCRRVQVAFLTKDWPRAFENPKLTVRKDINSESPYNWIEVSAPPGSRGFRFDVHWIKGGEEFLHGPDIAEMYLGNKRLNWSEIKSHYQYDKTWHVPCYWYQPEHFFNLTIAQYGMMLLIYFFVINLFVLSVVVIRRVRRGCKS